MKILKYIDYFLILLLILLPIVLVWWMCIVTSRLYETFKEWQYTKDVEDNIQFEKIDTSLNVDVDIGNGV
jgi:hypothetical protein